MLLLTIYLPEEKSNCNKNGVSLKDVEDDEKKFSKISKILEFWQKTENFQKIITFFATVENSTYIVYNPLWEATFMGKNKNYSYSLHSQ